MYLFWYIYIYACIFIYIYILSPRYNYKPLIIIHLAGRDHPDITITPIYPINLTGREGKGKDGGRLPLFSYSHLTDFRQGRYMCDRFVAYDFGFADNDMCFHLLVTRHVKILVVLDRNMSSQQVMCVMFIPFLMTKIPFLYPSSCLLVRTSSCSMLKLVNNPSLTSNSHSLWIESWPSHPSDLSQGPFLGKLSWFLDTNFLQT